MNESAVVDAFGKLGAAALLGLLLYVVLVKVGERLIRAIDKLADRVEANTEATLRVEVKLDARTDSGPNIRTPRPPPPPPGDPR